MISKPKKVGVLMLDTQFPRLLGDIGNPEGFPFPIIYKVVEGASPDLVVKEQSSDLLIPFIDAARSLIDEGAEIITTSCGFLFMFQEEIQKAVSVPVYTSSLMLLPELELRFGPGNVGILTISRTSMNPKFAAKTKIRSGMPIGTTENGNEFTQAILKNRNSFDVEKCREDNVNAAMDLLVEYPEIRAILLECTNMPPYAPEIEKATGLPVFSLNTLLQQAAAGERN